MVENTEYLESQEKNKDKGVFPEIDSPEDPGGELHLRFFLPSGDEFALPAFGIREVMQQESNQVIPVPNASPLLLGTINLRGQIIWVADLGQFLGSTNILNVDRSEIPIIALEDQETILGLAVDKLGAMEWLEVEKLAIPRNIPDSMGNYIQGEWVFEEEGKKRYVRLLDQIAILRSARWAA